MRPRSILSSRNSCKEDVSISAIVHLHYISDNRMAGPSPDDLQAFVSKCVPKGAKPRVTLATTGKKIKRKSFLWIKVDAGPPVEYFDNSYPSAWEIIGKLPTVQENVGGAIPEGPAVSYALAMICVRGSNRRRLYSTHFLPTTGS